MSGQQIGTVVGGAIGAYFGGPAGAQLGMAIGGLVGGAVDPVHINGPKIGDGQQQSATDGNPIAWVQGTAMIAGTIVQVSPRRQIRHKDNGKGGPVTVTYTAQQDFAILVCESSELRDSTVNSILMVIQDGKLVYDVRTGSKMLAASYKWKASVDFLFGAETQLPHPTLEAITGVGNTPAYRGSCMAVFKSFDVSQAGDRIPSFQFVVASAATLVTPDNVLADVDVFPSVTISTPVPPLEAPYGVRSVVALPSIVPDQFVVRPMLNWAFQRNWLRPIYAGAASSAVTALNPPASWSVANGVAGAVFDTQWRYYYGPPVPSSIVAAFTGANVPMPVGATSMPTGPIIVNVPNYQPWLAVELTQLTVFDSFSPQGSPVALRFASTDGMTLTPTGTGYYRDPSGQIWRPSWMPPYGQTITTPLGVSLQTIVERVCKRGGLTLATDVDASALSGITVLGYPIARQANAADCLLPLLQAYFGYGSEYEAKLHFNLYGANAAVTIDRADLIEGNDANKGAIVSNLRNQTTEFPRRVVASYIDPAQNYSVVDTPASRLGIDVIAIGDQSVQIPVAMAANDAAQAAHKALKVAYATLEGTLEYSTPFAGMDVYLRLAAGEPLQFQGKRYVADEMILGIGSIKFTTRYDRQSAYTSAVQAVAGNSPTLPPSSLQGVTAIVPMNLPSLRPQDSFGIYVAMAGSLPGWTGATVQVSLDGGVSWATAFTGSTASVFGNVGTDETSSSAEPLTVVVNGLLETVTSPQLTGGANAAAIVKPSGQAEILQFLTATEGAVNVYDLTGLVRAQLGTAQAQHFAGEQFIMLENVYFYPLDLSFAGSTIQFRGVSNGQAVEDAQVVSIVYAPDTTVIINGGMTGT